MDEWRDKEKMFLRGAVMNGVRMGRITQMSWAIQRMGDSANGRFSESPLRIVSGMRAVDFL